MRVQWVGNKATMSSTKHFNGALTATQMTQLAIKVITNATHTGASDRANGTHAVSRIIWGDFNGTTYAIVCDGADIKKGIVTIISFYDVRNVASKAKRFNMKAVS